jgi:hypothetical protein
MDLYIDHVFETKDSRDEGRQIRIVSREGEDDQARPRYQYVTVKNPSNPDRVGKTGLISQHTLDSSWTRID